MDEKKKEGYSTIPIPETYRTAIVNESQQEISTLEVLTEIRNDLKELKRKLIG